MKFILITIPIRSRTSNYPPVGATALLDALINAGYNSRLYDIDGLRPDFEEVVDFFRLEQPDILGISTCVSTAYKYTKELTYAVKQVSPKTKIILGGHLAASAEVLLRKCPIDICVIGEGEKILMNIVRYWEKYHDLDPSREEFYRIKGITFIDLSGNFIFTGYEEQLLPSEFSQPNYELLAKYSNINLFITDPLLDSGFAQDSRSYELHRKGQRCCYVMTGRGCVSRCTFCHRWTKGYRSYPIDNIINTIKYLKEKYNVGFFITGDESFGSDIRTMEKFIDAVRPLGILFKVAGIRMSTVYHNPGVVRRLKEAGCSSMTFGMESGSNKMLSIMEKRVTREQNIEVARILNKEGIFTCHQLVIGMPGENNATIKETIECLKLATEDMEDYPYKYTSITYFQSLPGTPGYEFMRSRGLIGKTIDDEEAYLLKISNVDAASPKHYVNVSEEGLSKLLLWPYRIRSEITAHWYKKHGWQNPKVKTLDKNSKYRNRLIQMCYSLRTTKFFFLMIALLGELPWVLIRFPMRIHIYGFKKAILFTLCIRKEDDRSSYIIRQPKSLRKIVAYPNIEELTCSEKNMLPLRMGR